MMMIWFFTEYSWLGIKKHLQSSIATTVNIFTIHGWVSNRIETSTIIYKAFPVMGGL
jgi:hypothetical protein